MELAWACVIGLALTAVWAGICLTVGIPTWAMIAGGLVCGVIGAKLTA